MIKKKRTTKIVDSLNSLSKTDVYSMMLFTLFKMHDLPEYSTLSELCYILDGENLNKFLSYYGGMTIRIPTLHELRLVLQGLLLYQYVNLEDIDFNDALKAAAESSNEFTEDQIKEVYTHILDVVSNYDFERQ